MSSKEAAGEGQGRNWLGQSNISYNLSQLKLRKYLIWE